MKEIWCSLSLLLLLIVAATDAFLSVPSQQQQQQVQPQCASPRRLIGHRHVSPRMSSDEDNKDEEEEEDVEPGKMRVSEIKAELEMRGIPYADCFDKESLAQRLKEARLSGMANPKLIDKFNKQRLEDQFDGRKPVDETLTDENIMNQAVGNDGTLPGGLSPDQFKGLVENPDVMTILQSSKMQEAMKLVMQGDQDELEKALKKDPELREMMQTLQSIIPTPDSEDSN